MNLRTKLKTFAAEQPRKMLLLMCGLLLASSLANTTIDLLKPCPCAQATKHGQAHPAAINIVDSSSSPAEQALLERARKVKEMITTQHSFSHADSVFIYQTYELLNQYKKKKHG